MIIDRVLTRRAAPLRLWACAAVLLCSGTAAASLTSYRTGFEPPEFKTGELRGQGDWMQTLAFAPSVNISTAKPRSGTQSVEVNLAGVDPVTYMAPPSAEIDPVLLGLPIVSVRMDVAFVRRSASSRMQFEFTTGPEEAPGHIAGFGIDGANGVVYAFNNPGAPPLLRPPGTIRPDEFSTLRADLDFARRRTTFYVNDQSMGSLAFATGAGRKLTDVIIATGQNTPMRSTDLWYYDNFSYAATPEPAGLSAVFAAAGVLLLGRRRKNFQSE